MSIIVLASDRKCLCNMGTKCLLGKCGCRDRCTEEELQSAGFTTVVAYDNKSDNVIRKIMVIGGRIRNTKNNKIKIR